VGKAAGTPPEHLLDKQIAAIVLLHDLTVATRNSGDFAATGVALLFPFDDANGQPP
jgi:predicted nucleic acid-binding protein